MAVPVISNLPPAPNRSDAPADFTPKADAMIGALQPMVVQINIALQWMNGRLTDAQAAQAAAAASAQTATEQAAIASGAGGAAAEQVQLAKNQVALATTQATNAANSAAAAEAAAGLGSIALLHAVALSF
ncbi:hypothetical protein GHO26_12530 [Pseudomonas helleri]|uniref:hypothetical protein n=1 Tax=Pseudomonas helleri TaxID=1608996 RepID=UPI001297988E|nr:hypothetical protein [Pseudomonas helleri]MQU58605.1 hypothetical protein [Pseudomonas helleri]